VDRRTASQLKKEIVVWLVTASKETRPQAVPVWFLFDGGSFLIFAQNGNKVNQIKSNPNVEVHTNTDESGNSFLRASGRATLSKSLQAHRVPAYVRKYGGQIKGFGWTPEEFSRRYPNVIRVKSLKFH
jgi:PPOX class probable F420-dependent enzyme